MVLAVIVILNMLIATMSNTFQKVTDNVDIEWAFGRTEVNIFTYYRPISFLVGSTKMQLL